MAQEMPHYNSLQSSSICIYIKINKFRYFNTMHFTTALATSGPFLKYNLQFVSFFPEFFFRRQHVSPQAFLGETNLLLTIACLMGFHSPNGFDINTPGLVTTVVAITKQYETFQGITNIQHVQESVAYLLPAGFTITAVIDRFTALTSQAPTNPSAPQVAPGQSPPLPRSSQQHVVVLPLVASSSPPHPLPGNAQQGSTEWLHCHTDFVNSVG